MPAHQEVIDDRPYAQALRDKLQAWGARRVLFATNSSLMRAGRLGNEVEAELGSRCAGVVSGIRAHVPRADVMRIVDALRDTNADAIVALGGGSVTAAVKFARLVHANGVAREEDIEALVGAIGLKAPTPRCIMLPTTLSGGEYTHLAGTTDPQTHGKQSVKHTRLAPEVVVLDPVLGRDTPPALWSGTAIRALDHIVETWCSGAPSSEGDACVQRALPLLLEGLRRKDMLQSQQAARWAIQGIASGVPQGASHGIGHALGSVGGVAHGETSCVMLPHVLRFNEPVNGERQRTLSRLWGGEEASLDAKVEALVTLLDLPLRLRDTGMSQDLLPAVAREAMRSPWVAANPRPIESDLQVLALLKKAW